MDPYQKQARTVYLVYCGLVFFLFFLVFSINSYFRVTTAKLDAFQLVLVGTALELSIFIFEIPTGLVADIVSRKLSILVGLGLMGLGFLLEGLMPSFAWIILAQVIWGFGYTFTSGALQAWISDETGEENAARIFLQGAQYEQIGAFMGIVIGTLLANLWIRLPYLISGGLLVFSIFIFLVAMPERRYKPTPASERKSWYKFKDTLSQGMNMLKKRPILRPILWSGLFIGLYSEGFDRLWVAFINDQFEFPFFSAVTWLGIIQGTAMVLSALGIHWIEKKMEIKNQRMVLKSQTIITALIVISLVAFCMVNQLWLAAILYIFIMMLRGVRTPLYTGWVNFKLDPQIRATVLSFSSLIDSSGQTIGGPLTGLVARQSSIRLGILTSAALLAPVLIIFGKMIKNNQDLNSDG
jgi:MFS transporter, DHA3 family, tetracycline resistance protein